MGRRTAGRKKTELMRVTFLEIPQAVIALERLKQITGAVSVSELLRQAVRLLFDNYGYSIEQLAGDVIRDEHVHVFVQAIPSKMNDDRFPGF